MPLRKISPLLDAMEIGECFSTHDGVSCYAIRHPESGREFVLKYISVPANQEQVEALLLTGAYTTVEEADAYYRKEAEGLVQEAEARKKLLDCPYILPFLGVQMEKKEEGAGYDVYAVLPKRNSLKDYLEENAISHLRGINMGIDLCVALSALREEGYVHGNLKPGNVYFSDTGRFLLGDFGLISTKDMQYTVLPEQYRSSYTAPELRNFLGGLNTTVDIYSLGMILYRIYNGNHAPFEDEKTSSKAADTRRLEGDALPAPLYADYELTEIIQRACAYKPEDRYQTPDQMRVALEQYMQRNAVSDHLIVPPLIAEDGPLNAEEREETVEPVRANDVEKLDEGFKEAFTPNTGKKKKNRKKGREEAPKPAEEARKPVEEAPQTANRDAEKPSDRPAGAEGEKPAEEPSETPAEEPSETPAEPTLKQAAERRKAAQTAEKRRRRRRRGWIAFAIAMVLLLTAIGLYEFTDLGHGLYHYFVKVEKLEVSDITTDSMKLHLQASVDADQFRAICEDAYGNASSASFEGSVATFTGLNPGTQYTLRVEPKGTHKVSGKTSVIAETVPQTEILTFTATDGSEFGAVQLDLVVKDNTVEPAVWTLRYGPVDGEPKQIEFSGHSTQILGLEPGVEYRFLLVEQGNLHLVGELETRYTAMQAVEADNLTLNNVVDGVAYVSWICTSELPKEWELTCTDPDGRELPVTVKEPKQDENGYYCSASIEGIEPGVTCSLKLSAVGMAKPLTREIRDEVIALAGFTAEATAQGVRLSWSPSQEPADGWIVTAAYGEGGTLETPVVGDSALIPAAPDTDYRFTLSAADGTKLSGTVETTARTLSYPRFSGRGVVSRGITLGTYNDPGVEDLSTANLGGGTVQYRPGERIVFQVGVPGSPEDSADQVTALYVIRTATGAVVDARGEQLVWNEMWNNRRWTGYIPWLPETAGSYSFSVYADGMLLGTINFTMLAG